MIEATATATTANELGALRDGTRRFYRPELDILRFLAFALVFLHHSLPTPNAFWKAVELAGSAGVPMFFVLSAYLITELLSRERTATGRIDLKAFYIRRALRIWPLYFAVLFLGFLLNNTLSHQHISLGTLSAYVVFLGNWSSQSGSYMPGVLTVLWSVSLEEQFYLAWPSVIKFGGKRQALFLAIILWLSSQICLIRLGAQHAPTMPTIWFNSLTHMQYFGLGAAASVLLGGKSLKIPLTARGVLAGVALSLFFVSESIFHIHAQFSSVLHTVPGFFLVGIGALLLLISFLGVSVPTIFQPIVFLGKISYGLYIFHDFCIESAIYIGVQQLMIRKHVFIFEYGLAIPVTLMVSFLSYRYLETPFLKLKEKFQVIQSRPV